MKTLQNLLERYAHIQAPDATIKKAFIRAVEEVIDIVLNKNDIRISNKVAYIKTASVIKSEIRFNQQDILKKVNEEMGEKNSLTSIL